MNRQAQSRFIFDRLAADERLNSTHIALYTMLVSFWKQAHYTPQFALAERKLKEASKVRSIGVYRHCLQELEEWGYLKYFPADEPQQESIFSLYSEKGFDFTVNKTKRRTKRAIVTLPVAYAPVVPTPASTTDSHQSPSWVKLAQVVAQAAIQVILVALNKHFNVL